jgi:predicted Zn-dependent peptidase
VINEALDRSKRPAIRRIESLSIKPAEKIALPNGIPLYIINQGTQDVCSIELNFNAGKWMQHQKLEARFTNRILREGTKSYNSKEISEKFDFYGAAIRAQTGADRASVMVNSVNKHLHEVLPIFAEIVREPVFPQAELDVIRTNGRERLKLNKTKPDYLAGRKITSVLFGSTHPYGYESTEEDYDKVTPEVLRNFYNDNYTAGNCFLMISGKVADGTLQLIEKHFGDKSWSQAKPAAVEHVITPALELKHRITLERSVQSAIRMGKRLFNKTHPDFQKMQVLNTILGGYFGSRLMSNIREDKGFTYGIHSGISSMLNDGYFYISTEVGIDVTQAALKEIYKEIDLLRNELIADDEMELVRNYFSGKILSGVDGPFKLADFYAGLLIYGLDIDYVHRLLETAKTITAKELRDLANRYLNTEDMFEVVVG